MILLNYWKESLIVGLIILVLFLSFLVNRKPKEIIKTETKVVTQVVTKVEVQTVHDNIETITQRTIDKPDGTKITEFETKKDLSVSNIDSKTESKLQETFTKTEIIKYSSSYILGVSYTTPISLQPKFNTNFENFNILAGVRVFSLPVFATTTISLDFKQASVGLMIEL